MISIDGAVTDLMDDPRIVFCLDTCDFLDVVRGIMRGRLTHARAFGRILSTLEGEPGRIQPVVSYLVPHEWVQNREEVRVEALEDVDRTNDKMHLIREAFTQVGIRAALPGPFEPGPLIQGLIDLAGRLLDRSMVLEKEGGCVERALERLMARRRPSHRREIKDSIHLEHYLELCRRLRQAGFAGRCVFVSSNKSDFWQDTGTPRLHPDLGEDLGAVGLEFFGSIEAALGQLRI